LFDKDGDGKISYSEVLSVFEKYDTNHSLKSNLMGIFDAGKSKILGELLSLDINLTESDYFWGVKTILNSETAALKVAEDIFNALK